MNVSSSPNNLNHHVTFRNKNDKRPLFVGHLSPTLLLIMAPDLYRRPSTFFHFVLFCMCVTYDIS